MEWLPATGGLISILLITALVIVPGCFALGAICWGLFVLIQIIRGR